MSSNNKSKPDPSSLETLSTFRSPIFEMFPSAISRLVQARAANVPAPALAPPIVTPSIAPLSMSTFVKFWSLKSWAALHVSDPEIVPALISPPFMSNAEPSISVAPAVSFPESVNAPILVEVKVSVIVTFPSGTSRAVWPFVPVIVSFSSDESQNR